MKTTFIYCAYLLVIFSHSSVTVSRANNNNDNNNNNNNDREESVHHGIALKRAYEKARTICPDKLNADTRYGIKSIFRRIEDLMAPSMEATDPNRKIYLNYVPTEDEVSGILRSICRVMDPSSSSSSSSGVDLFSNTQVSENKLKNELVSEEDTLSDDDLFYLFYLDA